jgi:hypothetical protein
MTSLKNRRGKPYSLISAIAIFRRLAHSTMTELHKRNEIAGVCANKNPVGVGGTYGVRREETLSCN